MRYIKNILYIFPFLLFSCKSEDQTEPYLERQIFYENFDNPINWYAIPEANDTGCVHFENGLLKLKFDQVFNNCGCAWVGAQYSNCNIFEKDFLDKIAIRIKLNKGYFQEIWRHDNASSGELLLASNFNIYFNSFWISIPNMLNGQYYSDSTLDLSMNKISGKEFIFLYNEGKLSLKIDEVYFPTDLMYFDYRVYPNHNLQMKFELGHLPELSPRIDTLYVDEIEIYTWEGVLKE